MCSSGYVCKLLVVVNYVCFFPFPYRGHPCGVAYLSNCIHEGSEIVPFSSEAVDSGAGHLSIRERGNRWTITSVSPCPCSRAPMPLLQPISASGQSPLGMCVSNGGLTVKVPAEHQVLGLSEKTMARSSRHYGFLSLSLPLREEDHMEEILLLSASHFLPHYHLLLENQATFTKSR